MKLATLKAHLLLLRPHQWTKNLLVFAALIFTARFRETDAVVRTLMAFMGMSFLSSSVYVFNDLRDAAEDRLHPKKRKRPIASGAVAPSTAMVAAALCLVVAGAFMYALGKPAMAIGLAYLVLQVLYVYKLRQVAVADVFLIATGFVLRAGLGAAAIDAKVSGWLLLCTGALALMLGFSKRRSEFIRSGESRTQSRASLAQYSKASLDSFVTLCACGSTLCYGLYALESPTAHRFPGIVLTVPFVVYGVFRYLLLVFSNDDGAEPEVLLFRDPHLLMSLLLFLASAGLAVSGMSLPLLEVSRP